MRISSFFLTLIPAFFAFSAYATGPVELAYARYEVHYGKVPGQTLSGMIRVSQALAPLKVAVHYTRDVSWNDTPAHFEGLDGTDQLWSFSIKDDIDFSRTYRFAVHADTAEDAVWDSNNWQNYFIDGNDYDVPSSTVVVLKEKPIALQRAFAYIESETSRLTGTIDVVNVGPQKDVSVVYSVNGGETLVAPAHYVSTHTNGKLETWAFDFTYTRDAQLTFSVQLDSPGQSFTDDNFGHSYQAYSTWVTTPY